MSNIAATVVTGNQNQSNPVSATVSALAEPADFFEKAYENYQAATSRYRRNAAGISELTPQQIQSLNVEIFANHVEVVSGGIKKPISLVDFRRILDSVSGVSQSALKPIALPYGCFAFSKNESTMMVSCYYPGGKKTITHEAGVSGPKKYNVAFPNLIITHTLKPAKEGIWKVSETKYFATPKTVPQLPTDKFLTQSSPSLGAYHLPFTNVYDNDTLCYGRNTMPLTYNEDNIRGLDYFYQILFISPFNNDLGIRGVKGSKQPASWYKELSELEVFPYDQLSGYQA